jgi:hypothetical protein
MLKFLADLKTGDIVKFDCGTFQCGEDSQINVGRSDDVYSCHATCLTGSAGMYYYPGSNWNFQGGANRIFEVVV